MPPHVHTEGSINTDMPLPGITSCAPCPSRPPRSRPDTSAAAAPSANPPHASSPPRPTPSTTTIPLYTPTSSCTQFASAAILTDGVGVIVTAGNAGKYLALTAISPPCLLLKLLLPFSRSRRLRHSANLWHRIHEGNGTLER
ncbi:hypothetical protein MSAN_00117600 [Mycena sanguinolenta]|uniref:Uncharacterized protein n=1 Tax=Mycena sanguinolenta TaxID=230812 RepID=A0A8H6ZFY1_9AGAR|nr:hypothetical protein MSAN_00117600 [Mycena sanguinolenta]